MKKLLLSISSICLFSLSTVAQEKKYLGQGSLEIVSSKFVERHTRLSLTGGVSKRVNSQLYPGVALRIRAGGPNNLKEFTPLIFLRYHPIKKSRNLYLEPSVGYSLYRISWAASSFVPKYSSSAKNGVYGMSIGFDSPNERRIWNFAALYEFHPRANFSQKLSGNTVYLNTHHTVGVSVGFRF